VTNLHGIIYAYLSSPECGNLVQRRTSSSLPFCSRYRLIDFPLSSMTNAGVRNVGVIMQRDYQSLLDHLQSGRDWNLGRSQGGLRLLPPFGVPDTHNGNYRGNVEALFAVKSYIDSIKEDNILLTRGDNLTNADYSAALERHLASKAEITAVVSSRHPDGFHHCFVPDGDGFAKEYLNDRHSGAPGLASAEIYITKKAVLLNLIDHCEAEGKFSFHHDALRMYVQDGGKIALYEHGGYFRRVITLQDYYEANLEMLNPETRSLLFSPDRPVLTKERAEAGTYFADESNVRNCLVADGCQIRGSVENCVLFRGVRIGKGAYVRNSIIMQDTVIGENVQFSYGICDKNVRVSAYSTLSGSPLMPLLLPKAISV